MFHVHDKQSLKLKLGNTANGDLECSSLFAKYYYRKKHQYSALWSFEQWNQQLSNLICQNCDGSIKILLDVGNQQHVV